MTAMFVYGAVLCTVLVTFQNVLPVCSQLPGGRGGQPIHTIEDAETLEAHVDTLEHTPGYYNYSTPSTPRPEDVDCYVEIPTTMRVGGTCVRYGSNLNVWLCQSGANAEVSQECRIWAESNHRDRDQTQNQRPRSFRGSRGLRYRRARRQATNP